MPKTPGVGRIHRLKTAAGRGDRLGSEHGSGSVAGWSTDGQGLSVEAAGARSSDR